MGRNGWASSHAFEVNEEGKVVVEELLPRTNLQSSGEQEFFDSAFG